jgi:tetratricopeptide (TPR) repeat protein
MAKRSHRRQSSPHTAPSVPVASPDSLFGDSLAARKRLTLLQVLLIVAAGFCVYLPALHGDWIWDDEWYITKNPLLQDPGALWKIWFVPGSWVEYYPIHETALWLQWQLWGNDTFGYHVINVALHVTSALLVWRLFAKLGLRLAWLGGFIFALHPVQVESVAWIVELKNTLSLPPFLLAMCAWVDYEDQGRPRDYFLALGLFLAAMLCKITMAPFPVVILLYAWWKRDRIGWRDLKAATPFFAISVTLGAGAIWVGNTYDQNTHTVPDVVVLGGILPRMALAGLSLSFYLWNCLWPVGLLSIYPQWTIEPSNLAQFLPWPILAGIACALWLKRATWGRHGLLGLGFFLLFLAPFLGFIAISYMEFTWVMDHFLYIPIIGLIGLLVAGLGQWEERLSPALRPWALGAISAAVVLMALESHAYASIFFNNETLWTYTVERNPASATAHNNLGAALTSAGKKSEALVQFRKAVHLQPDFPEAQDNLGAALMQEGRPSEAIGPLERGLQLKPDNVLTLNNLASALAQTGRLPEAIERFQQALRIDPNDALLRDNLANALLLTGHVPEAMDQLAQSLRINPNVAATYYVLGGALMKAGRTAEAIDRFQQALNIDPNFLPARNNLGTALIQAGRISEAIEQYQKVLGIDPDNATAQHNLARLQSGAPPSAEKSP